MNSLWVTIGVGVAAICLDIVLIVVAIRYRRGRTFSILGGVVLMLAIFILLACYLPVVVLPDVTANSADFTNPAPVDASATVFYLSRVPGRVIASQAVFTDTLIAVAARSGAIRWQRTLPTYASADLAYEQPRFVAADGVAFVTMQAVEGITVGAYRGTDGTPLWQTTLPGSLLFGDLAVDGERVYVPVTVAGPQSQVEIVALRASDGTRLWSASDGLGAYSAMALAAASGVVYVAARELVRAFRVGDGKPLWQSTQVATPPVVLPATASGVVYLPGASGGFSALRASDGATLCEAGGDLDVHAITLDGNTLYIAAERPGPTTDSQARLVNPETVYAYSAATCTPLWHFATTSSNAARGLIAGDEAVYVIADDGIHALRGGDGTVLWHRNAVNVGSPSAEWGFAAQPTMLGSTLYVTSGVPFGGIQFSRELHGRMHLYAIGPHGSDYWQIPVGQATTL